MTLTQSERKAETRQRLLAAAAELFATRGIDGVSVDAVADAAGRTSGAVYAHFGSKHGLLLAVLDEWTHTLLTALSAEVAAGGSPDDQLAAVWDNVGRAPDGSGRNRVLLELELWLRAARDPEAARVLHTRETEARSRSARQLERWVAVAGCDPVAEPFGLAILVKALLVGLAMQDRIEPGGVDRSLAVRGLAALLGLTPDTATPPDTAGHRHTTQQTGA